MTRSSPATETLLPCPFCAGPAVNVGGEYITCGAAWKHDCAGHQVRCLPCDWNARPDAAATPSVLSVLQEEEDRLRDIEGLRMGDVAMAFQRMRKRLTGEAGK